jgi:LacI family transcriptional regulator
MYVSLKDVAARAGVSFQTASKVLNGHHGVVSEATERRILAVAHELGYVPNALARSLVTRSTYTVGIVADDLDDWVLSQFVVGAERAARRQGHAVLIGAVERDANDGEQYVRLLMERRVDGILAAAPALEEDEAVGRLLRGPVPVVGTHHVSGGGVPVVGSDHALTGRLATEHLVSAGRRDVATITGPPRRVVADRLRGYRLALESAAVEPRESLVDAADWTSAGGYAATMRLLDREPGVDGIFAQSDMMAVGVLSALHERGRRVPDDCAVVGCDDLPVSAYLTPSLTTVHIPFNDTGARAMELLLARIGGQRQFDRRVLLPVHLVVRASSDDADTGHDDPATTGQVSESEP